MKQCEKCGFRIDGKYSRFCNPCRADRRRKPAKWVPSQNLDAVIREIYLEHLGAKTRPGVAALAKKIHWPKWAICKRARQLSLTRVKEQPWSEGELKILERLAWMSDERLRLKLKAQGFERTGTAIHLKVRRMRFKKNLPFYSARGLAEAFGMDSHVIGRWIAQGRLYARKRDTQRTAAQGGDIYLIHDKDVRRFCLQNPSEFDLRKVDQTWFMEMIR